jgi:Holliday junction resolvase-like predicted endonuclease
VVQKRYYAKIGSKKDMMDTKSKGKEGEDIAANFLEAKGYAIRKRNFHFGKQAELDIIAMIGRSMHFRRSENED